ncbi:hypothetical protein MNBD_GAMMA15-592 [hydrothermal vent metagenome]|uniref:Uncharacterized protein n=1 Tax=hydrothermal vent metagenome TaxID=652676 RepID=A0A3B0YGJ5_9ZZZZ
MTPEPSPIIGDWYKSTLGDAFEIVASDDDDDTLELQYYDGTIGELDRENWETLQLEPVEPPEDWSGSMDVSPEDTASTELWTETQDWMAQLERMERILP